MWTGWYLLMAGFLFLTLLSISPVSDVLTQSLVRRYRIASEQMLENIDVITVLGGGGEDGVPSGTTKERIFAGIDIFRKSGAKFLAVQGASQVDGDPTDAEIMKSIALEQGVPAEKMLTDSKSRTTAEHPARLQELLPDGVTRIGIVTSAIHMPRAMAVFQKYFPYKTIIALPVEIPDTRSRYRIIEILPSVDSLSNSTTTLHEWIGILWYKIEFL